MSGLLSDAISGLQASQIALRTTGNNISNANTAGYSRQTVNFSTNQEQQFGQAGYLGSGVNTDSVTRVVNDFVTAQLRSDTSAFNQLDTYNTNIGTVDTMMSDSSTGLSGGLQSFFSALQNSASDPSSSPARQLVITQAQSLTQRYNTLYGQLNDTNTSVNGQINTVVGQINALATSVANLNLSIASKGASSAGSAQPNDLLDQRDEALRQLSELASVQLVKQDGGDVNVFIGNGEPLVVGPKVSSISADTSGKIYLTGNGKPSDITSEVTGGKLGGLLNFKSDVLQPSFNSLGRVAIVMSDAFNKVQAQGLDINGNFGQPMFTDINNSQSIYSRVVPGNNAPPDDRVVSLKIQDPSALTIDDYKFSITPGTSNYTIKRASDNSVVTQGVLSAAYPQDISFEGLKLTLQSGSFQGGDSFLLQPTRTAAGDIQSLITSPDLLAFASPIRTGSSGANTGNGAIDQGTILSTVDANNQTLPAFAAAGKLSPPVIIHFTSDTTYEVLDNTDPANPKPLNPAMSEQTFYPNRNNSIFTTDPGETRIIGSGSKLGLPAGRLSIPNLIVPAPVYASSPAQLNNYPVEQYTFTTTDKNSGAISTQVMATTANASAAQTAAQLSNMSGVTAHAYTTATIADINLDSTNPGAFQQPLQLSLNGENLITYNGSNIDASVPNPITDKVGFNNYLSNQINSNANLQALGIRAESSSNPITGRPEVHLVASSGVNLDIRFTATNTNSTTNTPSTSSISVNDGSGNPDVRLYGVDDPTTPSIEQSAVTVGGRIDVTLAGGVKLSTAPSNSQILGDSTAANFQTSSYKGYQVNISGQPKAGDTFTVDFNNNSQNDNRNALAMTNLDTAATMQNNSLSFSQAYGQLVEAIGTKSNLSQTNTDASKSLLQQTQTMRDGISGVNMDEEASNLIQFQQLYTANARVISVAKDLFNTLIQSVS